MTILTQNKRSPIGRIDGLVQSFFDRWCGFWFTPIDPAALGIMRILVGSMLVYSNYVWGLELQAFLGPDGWNSAELVRDIQKGLWVYSFWWDVPVNMMETVHLCCLVILVLFTLGVCTRLTSVLSYIIHVSYCQRAVLSNYGLDQSGGVLLLYLMIGPSGAAFSVDNLVRRLWAWKVRRASHQTRRSLMSAGLVTRLMQVHYCVIYFFSGTSKLQGTTWWNGDAMWRAFSNYEYQSADMTWLAWYPDLYEFITHVTILWELSFAYLIWVKPLRPAILIIGALMHFGIGAFLGMWTFGFMMIFGYLCFLEPATVRAVLDPRRWIFRSSR